MESIYRYILRMRDENPTLPYSFQNENAGQSDLTVITQGSDISYDLRKMYAATLCDWIQEEISFGNAETEILSFLIAHKPVLYLTELTERIRLLLTTGFFDPDKLYETGYRWATDNPHDDLVRVGMIILGNFENDMVTNVMRILGYHSALTAYAIAGSVAFYNRNGFLFDLIQHTQGYGKLLSILALEPCSEYQQEWLFMHGLEQVALPTIAADRIMQKPDMLRYFRRPNVNMRTYPVFSRLIAYSMLTCDFQSLGIHTALTREYIRNLSAYCTTFIDLSAVLLLSDRIRELLSGNHEEFSFRGQAGYSREDLLQFYHRIEEVMKWPRWPHVVFDQLMSPTEDTRLIIRSIRLLTKLPAFESLTRILFRNPFDGDLLDFFRQHPKSYYEPLLHYAKSVLSEEIVFTGPLEKEGEAIQDHLLYRWPVAVLDMMKSVREFDEDFCLLCLEGSHVTIRKKAVELLQGNRSRWSPGVEYALQQSFKREPGLDLTKSMQTKINPNTEQKTNSEIEPRMIISSDFHQKVIQFPNPKTDE